MTDARRLFATAILLAAYCMGGCATSAAGDASSSVRVIRSDSSLGDGYVLVDVHTFRVAHNERGEMNRIARDYARGLGADTAVVRITDDGGPAVLFSVQAYRRIRGN